MLVPIPGQALLLLPSFLNYVIAVGVPIAAGVGVAIKWNADSLLMWWILAIADTAMAYDILKPALLPFLRANLRPTTDAEEAQDPGIYAARASSSLGIFALLLLLTVHVLGRTMLVILLCLKILAAVQAGCWASTVTNMLQAKGGGSLLPEGLQRLLAASPRELLTTPLRRDEPPPSASPTPSAPFLSLGELVWAARALTPVVLAPEEHKEEALALLPPKLLYALEQPIGQQLPSAAKQLLEPWAETAALRPKGMEELKAMEELASTTAAAQSVSMADAIRGGAAAAAATPRAVDPSALPRSSPNSVVPRLEIPAHTAAADADDANESPLNTPRSTTSTSHASRVAEALEPELLLIRIISQGVHKLAVRRVAAYREATHHAALAAWETARDLALAGPRWLLRRFGVGNPHDHVD